MKEASLPKVLLKDSTSWSLYGLQSLEIKSRRETFSWKRTIAGNRKGRKTPQCTLTTKIDSTVDFLSQRESKIHTLKLEQVLEVQLDLKTDRFFLYLPLYAIIFYLVN